MNKLKHTGIKISDYPSSVTNTTMYPHKLEHNHYFITYAPTYFGTSSINKNYKIPLEMLRQDQMYYMGLSNAKGNWQNLLSIWSGYWKNDDKTESYVYKWTHDERGSKDYIKNKFGLESDEENIDRIFFIKDAPIPMEDGSHLDPNPDSNKFVNKKYIDDRFNGVRKISAKSGVLQIRPYTCVYEYSEQPAIINIFDDKKVHPESNITVKDCLLNNILTFFIKFPVSDSDELDIRANGKGSNIEWSYPTEFTDILTAARNDKYSGGIWIKCFAWYTNGELLIRCSNALNSMPGGEKQLETTNTIAAGNFKVPTSDAVYHHVNEISKVKEGDFISITDEKETNENGEQTGKILSKISVKTSSAITEDETTVPTTKAVFDEIGTKFDNITGNISNNGIEVVQDKGKITSIGVTSATFDSNEGKINENTQDNVIIGSEVQNIIDYITTKFAAVGITYEIKDELPAPSAKYKGHVCLIKKQSNSNLSNEYKEYICINHNGNWVWEKIGDTTTEFDTSMFVNKTEFDKKVEEINNKIDTCDTVNYFYKELVGSTRNIKFKGKYVNLIENSDGSIDLIFCPNENPPFFQSFTSPTSSTYYVYKSNNGYYSLPDDQMADNQYDLCSPNTDEQTFYLNAKDTELCNEKPFNLICKILVPNRDDIIVEIPNVEGTEDKTGTSYVAEDEDKCVKVELTEVIKNTIENNPDGTPGYIRFKGKITVNQQNLAPNGCWYYVYVSIMNNGEITHDYSSDYIFAYKPSDNIDSPNFETIAYTCSDTNQRTVSGITYDNKGDINVRITSISDTQNQVTETKERLKLSFTDTNANVAFKENNKIYVSPSDTNSKYEKLTLSSGSIDNSNAIFEMSETLINEVTTKNNGVTKLATTVTANEGQQSGFNAGFKTTVTSPSYIWTKPTNMTDTSLISYFAEDGAYRILGNLNNNRLVITNETYDKTKSLSDEYTSQLLVQGGCLRHPSDDVTKTYSSVSNDRYYVRKIKINGSTGTQVDTLSITWDNIGNSFPSGVQMFLAKDTTSDIQELTAVTNTGINGCASGKPVSNSWKVQPKNVWNFFEETDYYLIIKMTTNAPTNLGKLTIQKSI